MRGMTHQEAAIQLERMLGWASLTSRFRRAIRVALSALNKQGSTVGVSDMQIRDWAMRHRIHADIELARKAFEDAHRIASNAI